MALKELLPRFISRPDRPKLSDRSVIYKTINIKAKSVKYEYYPILVFIGNEGPLVHKMKQFSYGSE